MSSIHNPDVLSCLANLSNDEVFTPPNIANQMLDLLPSEIWSNKNAKFLDPCCKSGVFLREIVKRLNEGLKKSIPNKENRVAHILKNQVYGIAITQLTALMSRRTVYCAKHANSRFSIYSGFDNDNGNIILDNISHSWKNDRCEYCGASKENYDRGIERESHAYQFIHTDNVEEIFDMKFDVIIGNPPYQMSDGGFGVSAKPIYHKFVQQAKKLDPRYLVMIIPSRWFAGGKGLDEFRDEMLNDDRIRSLTDFTNSNDCFNEVDIAGGICFFLWNRNNKGLCEVTSIHNNTISKSVRKLNEFDTFVRYNEAISILNKIKNLNEKTMNEMVSSRKPFGLPTNIEPIEDGDLTLRYNKGEGKFDSSLINVGNEMINKWKIITSKVSYDHGGLPDKNGTRRVLSIIDILPPKTVCSETYIIAGAFDNFESAEKLKLYLQTKFLRFLVSLSSFSQDITKDRFAFVPIQDFTESWTDEKLYKKYNLTADEIAFIESMIKPMGENSDINTADIDKDIDDSEEE